VCVCADARVIEKMETVDRVHGVTSVGDELYVLQHREVTKSVGRRYIDQVIAHYSSSDYQLQGHLSLPGFKSNDNNDMTSCVRPKCLYASDNDSNCIHRYDLASSATSKWSVAGKLRGLSVTPSGNLLVTCREPNKLVELSADSGQCVREIALQADIKSPWHGVQLTTGQYVVCHDDLPSDLHRVCVVGDDGKVTRSYGGDLGSVVGKLNRPCHLAVDKDSQFIFVADAGNTELCC